MKNSTKIDRAVALFLFALSSLILLRFGYIVLFMWFTGTTMFTGTDLDGHMLVIIFIAGVATMLDLAYRSARTIITGKPLE